MQDAVFTAAYSGERTPLRPSSLLHAWWLQAEHHLAGYQQQDAHEFYLSALSGLDLGSRSQSPRSSSPSPPVGGWPRTQPVLVAGSMTGIFEETLPCLGVALAEIIGGALSILAHMV